MTPVGWTATKVFHLETANSTVRDEALVSKFGYNNDGIIFFSADKGRPLWLAGLIHLFNIRREQI
jgi:hypothetical protein